LYATVEALMLLRSRIALLISALAAGSLLPLHSQQTASIVVKAGETLGPVNRLVFGQNIEAGDNARIFSSNTTNQDLIQTGEGFWDPTKGAPAPEIVNQCEAVGMSVLRYPGGCLAHNFDWRKSVGPDAKKNGWLFGVDEYLTLCHAIGAIPMITISDYLLPPDQMPENAAELVEYLNSPANAAHPWAMKRKEWGHPAPYNVIWFELGNESMHGNHRVLPRRQYSAEQYAAYANATAAAMRKVDPRIKLGIVLVPGPGTDVNSDWNRTVVHLAGTSADFIVIHIYAPQEPKVGVSEYVHMQAMMVAPQHVEERLLEYHQMIQQQLGHDLPLAVSEFNGGQDTFGSADRFTYANALECADLLRVFLKPELNVAMASYWNFLNGYYGMLRAPVRPSYGEPTYEEPAFLLYELWAQHFGSQLVKVDVQSPLAEFPGAGSEMAARGSVSESRRQVQEIDLDQYTSLVGSLWPKLLNVQIQHQNSDFTIHLQNLSRSIYPLLARIPRPNVDSGTPVEFTVSFDAKFTPDPSSDTAPMGIGLTDSRGWDQTHSGLGLDGITTDWKHLDGTYQLTAQTSNVDLMARLLADGKNVSGTLQVRNLVVTVFLSAHDTAYPLMTSSASTSADGKKLYVLVFNKSFNDPMPMDIHLTGFSAGRAQYWEVNGPSLFATSGVSITQQGSALQLSNATSATHVFPAHSMTAIEFNSSR
jgi:alpha-L-arabinofuranosidase